MRDEEYLIRSFVTHLEQIEAVKPGLSEQLPVRELKGNEGVSDQFLEPERAEQIREYLRKFEYGSRHHAIFAILLETGRRIGCLRALDLTDLQQDDVGWYLEFVHRPETPLKNDKKSEDRIYIDPPVAEVLEDYIGNKRIDKKDEQDREPLLTTRKGRISPTTIRKAVYSYTRPCVNGECPHDRDVEDCSAKQETDEASKCPSSRSPHAVRRGFATACRERGVTPGELSTRFDASSEVIEKHYDKSTKEERAKGRKEWFEQFRQDGGGFL
jgi:integrase